MTDSTATFEKVTLHIEPCDGWLASIVAVVDTFGFRLQSFVLRNAAQAGSVQMTLTVRTAKSARDRHAMIAALAEVPCVRRCFSPALRDAFMPQNLRATRAKHVNAAPN